MEVSTSRLAQGQRPTRLPLCSKRTRSAPAAGLHATADLGNPTEILAALQDVDYVVLFDEDTPYELIRRIRPDVLTKGADYRRDQVVGHDLVSDVRLIPLVQGRSTSFTINQIQHAA